MVKLKKLTIKMEDACQEFMRNDGHKSNAFRFAYNTKTMKTKTVNEKASLFFNRDNIRARVDQLKEELAERNAVTCDSLVIELEEARTLARDTSQPSSMVSATMGKAKLCGLDVKIIDHLSSDGSMTPVTEIKRTIIQDDSRPKNT